MRTDFVAEIRWYRVRFDGARNAPYELSRLRAIWNSRKNYFNIPDETNSFTKRSSTN